MGSGLCRSCLPRSTPHAVAPVSDRAHAHPRVPCVLTHVRPMQQARDETLGQAWLSGSSTQEDAARPLRLKLRHGDDIRCVCWPCPATGAADPRDT